ncbi:selenocysteine-specific translation elongation factor [Acidiferrimicrobium sp. IK]|uniref:selenocysteine-specific translation elongation factor n=1 Tax=Acidiferrimicrobium sp. IK TaxID=2871700 RepID=UPI0021CB11AD|nr:selenocysteine-specific translation elongation factor [Acidiferrimicrobium sp. IK]MCU4186226.1 selenocysteine-specific translation elongation factor [Acidiferrimicrobium sp. IK]
MRVGRRGGRRLTVHVVATAGHVDHGKSSLVAALTGIDPDRWAEEKARGLTIDLGFAHGSIAGHDVSWVDVPGHVRFIRNMLAGVGALDAAVLVVAATEGWKPQSEEHLRILDLLGVAAGVVALTKADLVDSDRVAEVAGDVASRLEGTGLAGAAMVPVDSLSGRGLPDLDEALGTLLEGTPTAADRGRPRLWVDRSFSASGAGTVVTGTLAGGRLSVGDSLVVVRKTGGPLAVRVRGLQVHGSPRSEVAPGHRVAANLSGVAHTGIGRGDALVRDGQWAPTRTADASLSVLAALDHPVSRRGAWEVFAGTGALAASVRILGPDALQPGETGLVRLHLPAPVPWLPGDRYILREHGRGETVGGGEILDVDPQLPAAQARPDRRVARVVAERGWVDAGLLERLTGETVAPTVGRWVVDPEALAKAGADLRDRVEGAGPYGVDLAALDERLRAVAGRTQGVEVRGGSVVPAAGDSGPGRADSSVPPGTERWLDALDAAPWAPPPPGDYQVARPALRQLLQSGVVVERDGVWWSAAAMASAAAEVAGLLERSPQGVTVAEVRDALGTSRKHVLPLLAHLDATGVTRRRGDVRIAGPRLPAVGPGPTSG